MLIQQEIEEFALQSFSILQSDYNFRPPRVRRESWITWIDFFKDNIAVEVEIDWRDFGIDLFLVRLEAGRLPKGLYRSGGKQCRVHLLTLIREKQWSVDQTIVSQIRFGPADPRVREVGHLKVQLCNYRKLLLSCMSQILAEGENLFE
jgi:hypothetical protein